MELDVDLEANPDELDVDGKCHEANPVARQMPSGWDKNLSGLGLHGCKRMAKSGKVGPSTLEGTFEWPEQYAIALEADLLKQLDTNLADGVDIITDYSGMGCFEQALGLVVDQRRRAGIVFPDINNYRACDVAPVPQRVLLAVDGSMAPKHVFSNILDRIPTQTLRQLKDLEEGLQQELRHRIASGEELQAVREAVGKTLVDKVWDILERANSNEEAFCLKHGRRCGLDPPPSSRRRLLVACAGSTCKDFSAFGKQLQEAGSHCLPFLSWAWGLRQCLPDIVIHENTA